MPGNPDQTSEDSWTLATGEDQQQPPDNTDDTDNQTFTRIVTALTVAAAVVYITLAIRRSST